MFSITFSPRHHRCQASIPWALLLMVGVILAGVGPANARARPSVRSPPDRQIAFTAGDLRCVIEKHADGIEISRLTDTRTHTELLAKKQPPLFVVEMNDATMDQQGASGGKKLALHADHGWKQVRVSRQGDGGEGGVKIEWRQPTQARLKGVSVTAIAQARPQTSAIAWTLSVHNDSKRWGVWEVAFPRAALADLGDKAKLFYPDEAGMVMPFPGKGKKLNFHVPYPGGSHGLAPFFASYQPGRTGLYVGLHDPAPTSKILMADSHENERAVRVGFDQPAAGMTTPGSDFTLSGQGVWRVLRGDWFDAALVYRDWASHHASWWPELGRGGREDTPLWMRKLPIWIKVNAKQGPLAPGVSNAKQFADFMGVPVGMHWYSWHQTAFNKNYPHFFPPKKGFAQGVRELQNHHIYVMPYINIRLWDTHDQNIEGQPHFAQARSHAMRDADGDPYTGTNRAGDHSKRTNAIMCPSTDFWQKTVVDNAMKLFNQYHVKGVYLDQLGGSPFGSPPHGPNIRHRQLGGPIGVCFAPDHGHPIGNSYWIPGYREIFKTIRDNMPEDRMITGEHIAEMYTRWYDGALVLEWGRTYKNQVPAVPAIYAGAIQLYGAAYSGWRGRLPMSRVTAARQFIWGVQLGWLAPNIVLEHKREFGDFLRKLARLRYQLAPYLYAGRMARPLDLTGKVPDYTVAYPDRRGWAVLHTSHSVRVPRVLTSSWIQRGYDHKLLLLFTNPSDKPVTTTLNVDLRPYGFTGSKVRIRVIKPGKKADRHNAAKNAGQAADAKQAAGHGEVSGGANEGASDEGEHFTASPRLRHEATFPAQSAQAWEITPASE